MFEAIRMRHEPEDPGSVRPCLSALMIDEWAACTLQVVDNLAVMAPDCREIFQEGTGIVRFMARHNQ